MASGEQRRGSVYYSETGKMISFPALSSHRSNNKQELGFPSLVSSGRHLYITDSYCKFPCYVTAISLANQGALTAYWRMGDWAEPDRNFSTKQPVNTKTFKGNNRSASESLIRKVFQKDMHPPLTDGYPMGWDIIWQAGNYCSLNSCPPPWELPPAI